MRQNLYWLYCTKSPGEPPRRQEILGYPTRSTSPACNFPSTPHTMSDLSPLIFYPSLSHLEQQDPPRSLLFLYLFFLSSQTPPYPPIKRSRAQSASSSSSSLPRAAARNVVSVTRSFSPFRPSLSLPTVTALGLDIISLPMPCL
ncbi:hypothetical protein CGRA01v4_10845 [Colletotrichum graminicola]|nr:hypothetical protein CGRA01v4_10845 [Colletotrichum graminicola]